jgi:DNA-binding MarR family transcriptional regulator
MALSPVDKVKLADAFYARQGKEVRHSPSLWHIFTVGHMLETDLNGICRRHGLSIADLNLLAAIRVSQSPDVRATDLAQTLEVSNASLSARVAKLVGKGLLVRTALPGDRRAFVLTLTPLGSSTVDDTNAAIISEAHFVRHFLRLPEADQLALERIMGELHTKLDRDFVHIHRPKV